MDSSSVLFQFPLHGENAFLTQSSRRCRFSPLFIEENSAFDLLLMRTMVIIAALSYGSLRCHEADPQYKQELHFFLHRPLASYGSLLKPLM